VSGGTLNLAGSLTGTPITVSGGTLSETSTGAISGTSSVTVLDGSATFSGANTYSGVTTINSGVLNIQNATALGTTASGTTVNGGTLQMQGGIAVGAEAVTLNSYTTVESVSGTNNYGGLVTFVAASNVSLSSDAGTV